MGALDFMDRLSRLDVVQNTRRDVKQRHAITPAVVERRQRKAKADAKEEQTKVKVWDRDGGLSRASGKPVVHASPNPEKRGDVAHIDARSTSPAKKYSVANNVLLTAEEHQLSDARTAPGGKALLEIRGKNANRKLTFIRRNEKGRVLWRRTSAPVNRVKP